MVLVYLLILLCDCQRTTELKILKMVGLTRFELVTPSLSGTYSNQLSYNPVFKLGSKRTRKFPINFFQFFMMR